MVRLLGDFPLPSAPTCYITPPPSPHPSATLIVCIYIYIYILPSLCYLPVSHTQVSSSAEGAQAGLH